MVVAILLASALAPGTELLEQVRDIRSLTPYVL